MTSPLGDWEANPAALREEVTLPAALDVNTIQPRIDINRQMSDVVSDAVRAIVAHNNISPTVFRSGGRFARIAFEADDGDNDIVLVKHFNSGALRGHLARVALWIYAGQNGDVDKPPPKEVVEDLLGNADIFEDIPTLRQIVHSPLFAADGTLHAEPGYSNATKCWYEPRDKLTIDDLPDSPSNEDVQAARRLLLDEYLCDFPFETGSDRSHALALLLLPFIRLMIPGPTPLHLIEASTPGTGKGMLGKAIFLLSHGADVPSMTECRDDAEWSKSLTAKFSTGQPIIFIDNVSRSLNSAKLAAALTQPVWEERLLGSSRMLIAPIRHVFVATGNNVSMSGELARRTIRCRLNARVEQPWMREGFKHTDLIGWGTKNRAALVRAALIIIKAWISRGRPEWTGKPLGSYEHWSRTLGGILEMVGGNSFLGNVQSFYDSVIDEADDERGLVMAWYEKYGSQEVMARDLVDVAAKVDAQDSGVMDTMLERQSPKAIAKRIRALHGRVFGELEVVHIPKKGKPDKYKIAEITTQDNQA